MPYFIQTKRGRRAGLVAALLIVLCSVCACVHHVDAIGVTLFVGDVFVVQETLQPHTSNTFQFQTDNLRSVIDVRVEDEKGNELNSWKQTAEGFVNIDVEDTPRLVTVYLDNRAARAASKKVNFYFYSHMSYMAAAVDNLDPIEKRVSTLAVMTQQMQTIQARMRIQQKEHRNTVDRANKNVVLWSVFQIAALIIMSGFQLCVLKRFLEKKTYM